MAFINTLYNLWPDGDHFIPGLRDGIAASAPTVFAKYGFDSNLVIAHFMAQVSHECGAGMDVVENLNYSTQRMIEVWPNRFNASNAFVYAHNPRALGNKTYNGRMGNALNSNDGYNFRGRGATQTTGRSGYQALQAFLAKHGLNLDLMGNPDLVNDPRYFLECGAADFVVCGCLPYAKLDNAVDVSALLNVGHIVPANRIVGFQERMIWLRKWKLALGVAAAA